MKKILYTITFLLCLLSWSCEDVSYYSSGTAKLSVSNLEAVANGADIDITWNLPSWDDSMGAKIYIDEDAPVMIGENPTTYTLENVAVNTETAVTVKASYRDESLSEGVTVFINKEGTNPVGNLSAEFRQMELQIFLSWMAPDTNGGADINIKWNYEGGQEKEATIKGNATDYTIEGIELNKIYSISVQTSDGELVSNWVKIEESSAELWIGTKIGYLIIEADISELSDDDEIAAANWFINKYINGEVITVGDIATGAVDLSEFKVIWFHRDRLHEEAEIPAELLAPDILNPLTNDYLAKGGNLLLSIHGTRFLPHLGRIEMDRMPGIFGSGTGGEGTDVWLVNPHIGFAMSPNNYDHTNHAVYAGMQIDHSYYPDHSAYPLIGPGEREDHNSMWDLNSFGYSLPEDGVNVVKAFESENDATVIGTWGGVSDYCCAGVVEFHPNTSYFGRVVAIGVAAYEWNQNSGPNLYQSNIEKFTESSISYLSE